MAVQTDTIIRELEQALEQITDQQLMRLIDEIEKARRVFVYGAGRSGLMLKAFAMRLMQMNYIAYAVGETITPAMEKGDLLIAASASGETKSVLEAAESARKSGVNVLTILSDAGSGLAQLQAPAVIIASPTKYDEAESSVQPLGSLFEQVLLLLCDAVVLKLSGKHADMNKMMADRHASIE